MVSAHPPAQHKLLMNGPPGNLSAWVCKCSCGKWSAPMPAVGPYGRATARARIAQATMAHGKHAKHAK